jgi:hypothetical protein
MVITSLVKDELKEDQRGNRVVMVRVMLDG